MSFLSVLISLVNVRVFNACGVILVGSFLSGCSSPLKYDARSGLTNASPSVHSSEKRSSQCKPYYKVVSGDTLSDIAVQCQVSMQALAKANDLLPPYFIYVKQELTMPIGDAVIAQPQKKVKQNSQPRYVSGSPLSTTATAASRSVSTSKKSASQKKSIVRSKSSKWQWPMHSKLDHRFIRDSAGLSVLEVYGLPGQAVATVAPGNVVYAGNGIINYGWMVVIKHDDDYMSIYAHNSALLVKEGDRVERGQQIALMGATGNTAKPKLYLEARYQGRKIDIRKVLKK